MLLTEVLRALLRFWYLLLCGAVVAFGCAYAAWEHTKPRFTAEASVLLLPPESSIHGTAPNGDDSNPLMNLGGLNQARDVLISAMASASQQEQFERNFSDTVYAVGLDPLSSGPILVLSVDAAQAVTATRSLEFLLGQFDERLEEMQVDLTVPEKSTIQSIPLTPPTTPATDTKPQLRAAALAGVAALVATVLLIAAVDGLLRSARRRRSLDASGIAAGETVPAPQHDFGPGDALARSPEAAWSYDADDFEAVRTHELVPPKPSEPLEHERSVRAGTP